MLKSSTIFKNENIDSIAIGGFDGMHRAHQFLLSYLGSRGALLVVRKNRSLSLTPTHYIHNYTKFPSLILEFEEIKKMSVDEFINFLKKSFPSLKRIVVGYDFRFAKERSASAEDLKKFESVEVVVVPERRVSGISVHAKVIKEFLKSARIEDANELLGRNYSITAKVIPGQGIGKKKLYATFNLHTGDFFLPKEGVYFTFAKIKNKVFPSLTFIGNRVTTDMKFSVETHILTGQSFAEVSVVSVNFLSYLRENRRFDTLDELKKAISSDIEEAKKFFRL